MSFATDMQRSLTPATSPLYMAGFRVWSDETGLYRLEILDTFTKEKEDLGLHASEERAWKVAALFHGRRQKAIMSSNSA